MAVTTPQAIASNWNNFCVQSGLDPMQLVCYTPTISDFGGAASTSVFGEYAAPSASTHVEGIFIPFDCLVVSATAKYVHDAAACNAAAGSSLDLDVMASPKEAESIAANYGKLGTVVSLTKDELHGKHWAKAATGLSLKVSGGTSIAFRSLVNGGNIDAGVNADIQLSVWLAVPQSKFALPTTQS